MAADTDTATRITDHRRIISFRNLLVHDYDGVDAPVVWDVVQQGLPKLLQEVSAILEEGTG